MSKKLLIVLLLGIFAGFHSLKACDCDPNKTIEQHVKEASVVILGTCVNITTNPIKGGLNVSFNVDSSWNRAIEGVTTFNTNSDNQCGFRFELDKQYVVFGKKKHQSTRTSKCEPNVLYAEGGAEIVAQLGKGFSPGRPELAFKMTLIMLGLGVGALLFIAFVVLRKRIFPPKKTTAP